MTERVLNALAWVSLVLAFIVFIISYASFPEEVLVYMNLDGEPELYLERNMAFYVLLGIAIIFNGGWLALSGIVRKTTPQYAATMLGISVSQIAFNFFFATAVYFINLLNSRENFDYSTFGYLIYSTGGILIVAMLYTAVARFILKK